MASEILEHPATTPATWHAAFLKKIIPKMLCFGYGYWSKFVFGDIGILCPQKTALETYTIVGERGSGQVGLNGPAARKVQVGDIIIVIAYGHMTPEEAAVHKPTLVFPDTETNRLIS